MNTVLTNANFKEKVLQTTGLTVVKFFAEWSGTCQMMVPVYKELASAYSGMISFYKVDVDKAPLLKSQYGIMELPTVLFFHNGEVVDFITGAISKNAFIAKLENNVSNLK